jgi:hypothetical protein
MTRTNNLTHVNDLFINGPVNDLFINGPVNDLFINRSVPICERCVPINYCRDIIRQTLLYHCRRTFFISCYED